MATALVLSLLFLASALLLFLYATRPKKPNQLPSPPKLPIIENLHQPGSLPHRSLRLLSHKHGSLMLLHLFPTPTLIISSTEMAHQIMKTHHLAFANRPLLRAAKHLFYDWKNTLFSPYGECWRLLRKIYVLELLSNNKVRSFHLIREEEVGSMIDQVSRSCPTSSAVDLRHVLTKLTGAGMCWAWVLYQFRSGQVDLIHAEVQKQRLHKLLQDMDRVLMGVGSTWIGF